MYKFVLINEEYQEKEEKYEERRRSKDRRVDFVPTTFPVYTRNGTWVRRECRKTPERRIDNINVAETHIDAEEFKELFKDFSK